MFYIYKIKDVNYIGSCKDIKERTNTHKTKCWNKKSNRRNLLVYKFIRQKNKNIELEILFCYKGECSNKIQRLVEQFYINKYDSKNNGLNMYNAFTNNIKASREYAKEYRKNNPNKYKEYNKKYCKKYYKKNKKKMNEYHKKYLEKNKKKMNEYHKKYREENKEILNQKKRTKINCPFCNDLISKRNLKRHQRNKKCKNFI